MKTRKSSKIKSLTLLAKTCSKLKKEGKKIVLCHGVFDLLHPGHIRYFKSAKKHGDILVVTITADKHVLKGPGRPVFNQKYRSEVLAALEMVDYVAIINDPSSIKAVSAVKPDFYVKGPDYKRRKPKKYIPRKLGEEKQAAEKWGGKLVFTDDVVFSSSHLINKYLDSYPQSTQKYLTQIRKKYSAEEIIDQLCSLKTKKILVIGDAIIDQYRYTLPQGKSSKEPVVVHKYQQEESFAGGTLATANHLASLSNNIFLITLLGKKKSFERFVLRRLRPQINPKFFYQNQARTIIKRRYIDQVTKQKLFQISYMKDEPIDNKTESQILSLLKSKLPQFDMVLVNDFGHGLLTPKIIRWLCRKAPFLTLNVQANSANYGFNIVTKYPRADFVCIDEQELRLATHDKYGEITKLVKYVARKLKCDHIIVTRGSDGSITYTKGNEPLKSPALSVEVIDRVGAGDAFFSITSPCAFIGMNQHLVALIGNMAGALKVQTVGNRTPIDFKSLTKFITRLLK